MGEEMMGGVRGCKTYGRKSLSFPRPVMVKIQLWVQVGTLELGLGGG